MLIYEKKSNRRFFNFQLDFSMRLTKVKKGFSLGTYSICEDGKHVIYLDYDNFRFEWMKSELECLQNKYLLSPFYILESSNREGIGHYHAVCFDKISAQMYNNIIQNSNADVLFKNNDVFDLKNSRVLRFSAKTESPIQSPKFLCKLDSEFNFFEKSTPHINFYEKIFNFQIDRSNEDYMNNMNIISYITKNL